MFLFDWAKRAASWIYDKLTTDDAERVENAYHTLEEAIIGSPAMVQWLKRSGWKATGGDGAAAMRNPLTRDAAIFDALNSFYACGDDPTKMLARFAEYGLNNGTSTHAYIINSGAGSIGQSGSNHQGALLVDETANPPRVTLVLRGMNPTRDWRSPLSGLWDTLWGRSATECQSEADQFWEGAKGDIARIMADVAARHPGQVPVVTVAGHSYGSDGAARLIPKFAQDFPQVQDQLQLVGYGAVRSFTAAERDRIMAILGNDANRARQYMTRNDWINYLGFGQIVGTERDIPIDAGHLGYAQAGDLQAMMAALHAQMAADPKQAEQRAKALVEQYKRDPNATLASLAAYTSAPPEGGLPAPESASRAVV
jgi:hypothetical protein